MTLSDIGVKRLELHSPPGLSEILSAASSFARRDSLDLQVHEHNESKMSCLENDVMKVEAIISRRSSSRGVCDNASGEPRYKRARTHATYSDHLSRVHHVHGDGDGVTESRVSCPSALLQDVCVSYVCRLSGVAGKFDAKKAQSLGLKPGPLYGVLKSGKAVQNDEGITIHPHDVVAPTQPGRV